MRNAIVRLKIWVAKSFSKKKIKAIYYKKKPGKILLKILNFQKN